MSIATDPKLSAFYRWLKTVPLPENPSGRYTQQRLADDATCGRTNMSLVLSGKRRGDHTWPRVIRAVPKEGLFLLRQCPSWNNFAEKAFVERMDRDGLKLKPQAPKEGAAA